MSGFTASFAKHLSTRMSFRFLSPTLLRFLRGYFTTSFRFSNNLLKTNTFNRELSAWFRQKVQKSTN